MPRIENSPKQQNRKQTGPRTIPPAGKEGEKKQKIRAIAIALAIVVIAFICVWFAARNMSNEADSTQIEDMEHEEIDIPDQDESGFDFEWKD